MTLTPVTEILAVELSQPSFLMTWSVATGDQTPISRMRCERSTKLNNRCGVFEMKKNPRIYQIFSPMKVILGRMYEIRLTGIDEILSCMKEY